MIIEQVSSRDQNKRIKDTFSGATDTSRQLEGHLHKDGSKNRNLRDLRLITGPPRNLSCDNEI